MKESGWAYLLIVIGLVIFAVLTLVLRYTSLFESDFYLGREILASSMSDAVDLGTYRSTGELVMSKEKFVEIFIRRFVESVSTTNSYQIDFYDIREYPPKASVRIRTATEDGTLDNGQVFRPQVDTLLSGVLETVRSRNDFQNASAGYYDLGDYYPEGRDSGI